MRLLSLVSLLLCAGFVQGQSFLSEIEIADIEFLSAKPRNEMQVVITKVEGKNLLAKKIGTFRSPLTLPIAEKVAVVHGKRTGGKVEAGPAIEGGVDNHLFAQGHHRALLFLDEKARVDEIRVLPDTPFSGKPVKPVLERIIDPGDLTVISCLAFSPEGKRIVTGEFGHGGGTSGDGVRLRMWDASSGRLLWNAPFDARGNSEGLRSVAFSADGTRVVAGSLPGHLHVHDAADGKRLFQGRTGGGGRENPVFAVAFAPDGVVLGAASSGHLAQLDPDAAAGQGANFAGTAPLVAAAFSRDARIAMTASEDRTAKKAVDRDGKDAVFYHVLLWDIESMLVLQTLPTGLLRPNHLELSTDGRLVLMASQNEKVLIWDRETGKQLHDFKGTLATFSPDGKRVATAGRDHVIRLWDLKTGKEVRTFDGHYRDLYALRFSPDGNHLLSGGEETVARLWSVADGKEVCRFGRPVTPLRSLAVSANGKMLVVGGRDGVARAWDLTTGKQTAVFDRHLQIEIARKLPFQTSLNVALSPDGKLAATAAHQTIVWIWDPLTGKEIHRLEVESGSPMSRVFFPDGKTLCTTVANEVLFWDVVTGKIVRQEATTFNLHEGHLVLSRDGRQLLRGDSYGVLLWDFGKKKIVREILVRSVSALAFGADDGQAVFANDNPPRVALLDLESGKIVRTYSGHKKDPGSVSVSPDGKRLLAGCADRMVRLYDLNSGDLLHTFAGHRHGIRAAAFLPGTDRAITAGEDGSLRLWDTQTGQALCEMVSFRDGRWAVIDEAGRFDGSDKGQAPLPYYRLGSDIVPFTQLRETYYEPGLLARHLGHDRTPLREVTPWNKLGWFPHVEARWIKENTLSLQLTNRGGGIGAVKVFVNDRQIYADARPALFDADAPQAILRLDLSGKVQADRPNRIRVVAFSKDGTLLNAPLELER